MKKLLALLILVVSLGACDDSAGPDDADYFVLRSIAGDEVPAVTDDGDATIHASTITLFDDGDAEFTLSYQLVGASRTNVELFGDWTATSTSEVLIDLEGGDQLIATRSGNLLLIDDVNGTWRYERR